MTIVEPVVVSILRERGEEAGAAEMERQYQRFMSLSNHPEAAAQFFVEQ
jgi:hypothetical protein